jgi:hypothetical protein
MKRLLSRRRPEFEALESMLLLSGASATDHHPAAAAAVGRPSLALGSLFGTASGTYSFGRAAGAPVTFSGKGNVSPLGRATVRGSLQLAVASPSGRMIISARHGKVFADLSTAGLGAPVFYTITGGTGRWAGAAGLGEAIVNTVPSHGKGPAHGRLTITLEGPPL